jgi:hypothetical protein
VITCSPVRLCKEQICVQESAWRELRARSSSADAGVVFDHVADQRNEPQ